MKNSNKKGFTIVELVIVIAVIAILAAVLIPTFSNITEKSRVASDMTMIRNINTGLQADEALHGKPGTMHGALEIALNTGYKLENIEPISESEVIYDSKNNRFALIDKNGKLVFGEDTTKAITEGSESGDKHLLWKIAKADADVDTILNAGYSVYLANTEISGKEIALTGLGFDVGDNAKAFTVTYRGAGYETVIRTNIASTLTIDAANDTVKHYGAVDTLTITAIASNSYHEFGFVKTVGDMGSGRFVAEGTAKFHQKKDEISFGSMTFEEKSGVTYGEHLVINGEYACGCSDTPEVHEHTWEKLSDESIVAKCTTTGVDIYKCTFEGCEARKVETHPALGHLLDNGTVTKAATEEAEGEMTFKCTRDGCEYTETKPIPKSDHVHDKKKVEAKAATCTEKGNIEYYTCTKCHNNYSDEAMTQPVANVEIDALGHQMSDWTTITSATCTTDGSETRNCSRCNEARETREIKATGHSLTTTRVEATCTKAGNETTTCSVCNKVLETKEIPATSHTWGTPVTTAATCGKAGSTVKTCSTCGATDTTTIPATGNHTWNAGVVTTEATCAAEGTKTFTCTVCKTTKTEKIAKTDHNLTYTHCDPYTGKHIEACTVCDYEKTVDCKNEVVYSVTAEVEGTGDEAKAKITAEYKKCKCGAVIVTNKEELAAALASKSNMEPYVYTYSSGKQVIRYQTSINNEIATICLGADIQGSSAFSTSKTVTINLNGHTLSSTANITLKLNAGADVTIVSDGNGKITNEYSGSADATTIDFQGAGAVLTLKSGTVESNAKDDLYTIAIANSKKKACTVNIEGGIVSNFIGHVKSRAISASNGMTVNINGGTISGGLYAMDVYAGSTSNIFGGKLFANGKDGRTDNYGTTYAIHAKGEATITIGSKSSDSRPEVRGIKFESSGVKTELPTITLVKGDITNPIYSMEKEYNYSLFKLGIDANADVTFSDDTAKHFLKDGLGIYDKDESGKTLYNESGKRYYIVTTERPTA